jgi:hypothetical protein
MGKVGRSRSALDPEVAAAMVDKEAAAKVGRTDVERKYLMVCRCGRHKRYITVKGTHMRKCAALSCKVCSDSKGCLSTLAKMVAKVMDAQPHPYAWEVKHFPLLGPFDFYIPELGLAVEADGVQHYEGTMHGEYYTQIRAKDDVKWQRRGGRASRW